MTGFDYVTDGSAIYRESFTIIRAESDLGRFSPEEETVAVRMIHAAGQTDLAEDIVFSPGAVSAARAALEAGKPIFTDVTMIASGITRRRLPADNEVICTLNDERTPGLAAHHPHRSRSRPVGRSPRRRRRRHRQCPDRAVSPARSPARR